MQVLKKNDKLYEVEKVDSWLREFAEQQRELDGQYERLERLQARLESYGVQEISDMPRSPSPPNDRVSVLMSKKIDLEQNLKLDIKEHQITEQRIEYVLNHIEKARERTVIRMRYIDDEPWDTITFTLFGDLSDYTDKYRNYMRRSYLIHCAAKLDMAKYFKDSGDPEVEFFKQYIPKSLD